MNIIEVLPLIKGTQVDTLSYYSAADYEIGTIISVPIRNQTKKAIVIDISPVSTVKTTLKAATFTLKKLPPQESNQKLPLLIIEVAKKLTKSIPAEMGAILFSLLPKEIISGQISLPTNTLAFSEMGTVSEVSILHGLYEDRFRSYRSLIRETFAHRGSVLFIVPTSADVERAKNYLEKGIENRIITFSSSFTKHKLDLAYEQFNDLSHAKLIVTTPSHIFLDRHDITNVIVDQSRSRAYKSRFRPYLDIRDCIKQIAKLSGRNLLFGDLVPRTEDEYLRREEIYFSEEDTPKRLSFSSNLEIVEHKTDKLVSSSFNLFSPILEEKIREIVSKRENIFMYAARRGIAPVVACMDCGFIFRCPDSGAPYSLFKTEKNGEEKRWFVASASGKRIQASDTCTNCGSWRLREKGIGIQHIESELKSKFPHIPVITFDHTSATTYRRALSLIGKFYDQKGAILLGTAMVMPYIEKAVPYSIVTSLDAARAIPTWRADEELFSLLLSIREKTSNTIFVQTRTEPDELLQHCQTGSLEKFYDEEIELRQQLKYPPFSTFIHLTFQGTSIEITDTESKLTKLLADYSPRFYHAPTTTAKKATRYCLLKIPKQNWPDEILTNKLRSLPPNIRIEVNPDRLV